MREPGDLLPPAALARQIRGELRRAAGPEVERKLPQRRLRRLFGEAPVHRAVEPRDDSRGAAI